MTDKPDSPSTRPSDAVTRPPKDDRRLLDAAKGLCPHCVTRQAAHLIVVMGLDPARPGPMHGSERELVIAAMRWVANELEWELEQLRTEPPEPTEPRFP